ncbi:DUF4124 domain-containing protein [Variovorax sp. SRS16]|uniref:DUF4124 domain-containing protein n=1 Tax=Variovorax sp. SRS16 TaxID=282217 RepID=UPI001E346DEB|nr:DUF4124 domain-containing protein [Variovorax sp. SRS16]
MNAKMPRLLVAALFAALVLPVSAQPKVYRCETNGRVAYSDAPCVGAKPVDVTPTQGMDRMGGQSRKGREVQNDEFNSIFDSATGPLHGRSHEDMNVMRRRVKLPTSDQTQCTRLDGELPQIEEVAARATGAAKAQADVDLYKARKRFFDLKC